MACIKSAMYSFVNNGVVFGDVRPQRGMRRVKFYA